MSLTIEQKDSFKSLFIKTVEEYSKTVSIATEQVLLQIIPLTIQAASDYLTAYEKTLQQQIEESKQKTMKIKKALEYTPPKENQSETQTTKQTRENPIMASIIGKKCVRGKDWKWSDQDGGAGGEGKIIQVKSSGWIKVKWFKDGSENKYRWGYDGKFDLKIIDEFTNELDDGKIPEYEEQMKKNIEWVVGKYVVRGKDWEWNDQDGGDGHIGLVKNVCDDGWVEVKWLNGKVGQYRWGSEDCYDLMVVNKPEEGQVEIKRELKEIKEMKELKESETIEKVEESQEVKEEKEVNEMKHEQPVGEDQIEVVQEGGDEKKKSSSSSSSSSSSHE